MDKDKEIRLREIIRRGENFEPLKEFISEFYEVEKGKAIVDLLSSSKDAETVRADLRASKRLVDYIKILTARAEAAKKIIDKNK
ncbi:hypothetical protein [Dialister succinatiphilus]|uniref:hypothetical protein n=1 Tax=Dialister succinatiphilus TaxID=487173 RepID=UPI003AF1A8FC